MCTLQSIGISASLSVVCHKLRAHLHRLKSARPPTPSMQRIHLKLHTPEIHSSVAFVIYLPAYAICKRTREAIVNWLYIIELRCQHRCPVFCLRRASYNYVPVSGACKFVNRGYGNDSLQAYHITTRTNKRRQQRQQRRHTNLLCASSVVG